MTFPANNEALLLPCRALITGVIRVSASNRYEIDMYRRVFAVGSTPFERLSTLYVGAMRLCKQGRKAAAAGQAHTAETKAEKVAAIVTRLDVCLDHAAAPELCANLSRLYTHIHTRLADPSTPHEPAIFEEVLGILDTLWTGFQEAEGRPGS